MERMGSMEQKVSCPRRKPLLLLLSEAADSSQARTTSRNIVLMKGEKRWPSVVRSSRNGAQSPS